LALLLEPQRFPLYWTALPALTCRTSDCESTKWRPDLAAFVDSPFGQRALMPWSVRTRAPSADIAVAISAIWPPCRPIWQMSGASFTKPIWTPSLPPERPWSRSAKVDRPAGDCLGCGASSPRDPRDLCGQHNRDDNQGEDREHQSSFPMPHACRRTGSALDFGLSRSPRPWNRQGCCYGLPGASARPQQGRKGPARRRPAAALCDRPRASTTAIAGHARPAGRGGMLARGGPVNPLGPFPLRAWTGLTRSGNSMLALDQRGLTPGDLGFARCQL
jgi:hypothetical protein